MEEGGLLALVVAMGGGIAYIADRVGKHLGKKRLSLFGLRPRHTAAVGTVLLGVIITLFTFATIWTLSSSVRTWVATGPGYMAKARKDLQDEQDKVREAEGQSKRLSDANKALTAQFGDMSTRLAKGQGELKSEQRKYANLRGQTENLQANISSLNRTVGEENRKIQSLGNAEQSSEQKLKSVRVEEKQAEDIRNAANEQKNEAVTKNLELTDQNGELQNQQTQLQTQIKNLQTQRATAKADLKDSQNALDQAKRQLGDVEAQLGDVQLKLKDTLNKLQDAETSAHFFTQVSKTALTEPLLYSDGEEIARRPLRANLSPNAAREEITTLIRTARIDAKRKGALDADIYYHVDNDTGARISPQELEQQLASQISGVQNNQVLIACSSLNAFRTENVSLEILVRPNPMVFSAGQMIAEAPIDANKGDKVIVSEVSAFLKDKVRAKALEEGLIPPINSDVSIGEVTFDEMLTLVQRIRESSSRQVRLQVLAEGSTRAADSLRLVFRIR